MLPGPFASLSSPSSGEQTTRRAGRRNVIALAVAGMLLLGLLLYELGTFAPASTTPSSTTSTSYDTSASSVLSSASGPASAAGYIQGAVKTLTPRESGLETAGYAILSDQGGDSANMTILVFNSTASAQRYTDSVIRNAEGLPGYSNANSTLAAYQRYGACYGYAETDPDGNGAIATGVCSDGNVYIQVHFISASSIGGAEGGMGALVGAAFQSVG